MHPTLTAEIHQLRRLDLNPIPLQSIEDVSSGRSWLISMCHWSAAQLLLHLAPDLQHVRAHAGIAGKVDFRALHASFQCSAVPRERVLIQTFVAIVADATGFVGDRFGLRDFRFEDALDAMDQDHREILIFIFFQLMWSFTR